PTILSEEMCFGTKTASIKFKLNSADTFNIKISLDSQQYYDTSKIFNGLSGGLKQFFVRSNSGCTYKSSVNLFSPEPYTVPIKLDTTLCNGQRLMLNAHHPSSVSFIWKKQQTTLRNTDTITISNAGNYQIFWMDKNGCIDSQGVVVKRELLDVNHDFLVASEAFLNDTVYAVNISYPVADNYKWANSDQRIKSFSKSINTLGNTFPDTGFYRIHLYSKYKSCGFELSKTIHILGKSDTSSSNPKLGYKGPLIQSFSIDPNPNDGHHFTIKIQLRDTHNISIYKLDPVSGDIIGDIDLRNKKYYESTAFTDPYATPGVYYLKVVAGNEHKTIKYIVAK
ncbi:MAG: hypothetical protein IT244_10690, partial [Bacteroidia bacterium]|nr:hypothetical protein [Bacteroidia bacterium]